jgi:L-iditol 2-dehydrogenase
MMKAAFLTKPRQFEIRDIAQDAPAKNSVLIKLTHAGICGSDLHFFETGRIGDVVLTDPFIMGHEFSGVVADTNHVTGAPAVGTRVAVDPAVACEECVFCRNHQHNLCANMQFTGFPPYPGAFREWIWMPVENLFPMPDCVSSAVGPLLETLAVAVHGLELMPDVRDTTCAVLGAGAVGLLTALVLKDAGANIVLVTEPVAERRQKASEAGCEFVFDPHDTAGIESHLNQVTDFGPEFVFEAAGEPESYQMALDIVRPAGRVCLFGIYPSGAMPLSFTQARRKEITIKIVRRSLPKNYPEAIHLVETGRVDLLPLATHIRPFDDIQTAFEMASKKDDGVLKAILEF